MAGSSRGYPGRGWWKRICESRKTSFQWQGTDNHGISKGRAENCTNRNEDIPGVYQQGGFGKRCSFNEPKG